MQAAEGGLRPNSEISMSRELVKQKRGLVAGAAIAVIVIGVIFIIMQLGAAGHGGHTPRLFYSDDDGATVFAEQPKQPPFDHGGREAVQAYVFTCDDGQHRWVQYLEKYSDQALKRLESGQALSAPDFGLVVKQPGTGEWVPEGTPDARKITEPKCPDGQASGTIKPVIP